MVTGGDDLDLHVVFLLFLAQGHMIPLVHAARLFASRGVRSTIITTVQNARNIQASLDHDIARGYPICVNKINFPASDVGLPSGIENMGSCPTREMARKLIQGLMLLQTPMELMIHDLVPDCIFSDMCFWWTVDLAEELNIPRLLFYPNSFFYHSVMNSLTVYAPHVDIKSEDESFLVPNLPDNIFWMRSQLSDHYKFETPTGGYMEMILKSEERSYGLVHDTFYELEPAYADHVKNIKGTKLWHIGPLFHLLKSESVSKENDCLTWLDEKESESVIYVCFGSMTKFSEAQIFEIALALEECTQPFIWVVKKGGNDVLDGLPDGFMERIERENKGLIITGWVPQVEILKHSAVGGFLTHCGWNSLLEAMVSGVPVITWPLYAEQFYNEKLVVLLGIGTGVGAKVWNPSFEIASPVIGKQSLVDAIGKLTKGSAIAEAIRRKSKEVAIKAIQAAQEDGSSYNGLTDLIKELKAIKLAKSC